MSPPQTQSEPTPAQALRAFRERDSDLWAYCTDLDVRTLMALTRALAHTVRDLSPVAEQSMFSALSHEIDLLERQGDQMSQTVAMALKQYVPGY